MDHETGTCAFPEEGEGCRGGGSGEKQGVEFFTTVNETVTPGVTSCDLYSCEQQSRGTFLSLSPPPLFFFFLLKRCTCYRFSYKIAWWYISFFIL